MKQEIFSDANVGVWRLPVGQMRANCYILVDKKSQKALLIDPGDDGQYIIETVIGLEIEVLGILATHGHFDHVMAGFEVQKTLDVPFYMHPADQFLLDRMSETAEHFLGITVVEPPPTLDRELGKRTELAVGDQKIIIHETPGHTPGSVCIEVVGKSMLFTGDTIFAEGNVGRTDFSYSDEAKLKSAVARILAFPDDTMLLSGHGEETTVKQEKQLV